MRLIPIATVFAAVVACGARTGLDSDGANGVDGSTPNVGALDADISHGADASSIEGALCAWQTGIVSACDAGQSAGPVQRCERYEQCLLRVLPDPAGGGEELRYYCCVGAPEKTACFARQFNAGYACQ